VHANKARVTVLFRIVARFCLCSHAPLQGRQAGVLVALRCVPLDFYGGAVAHAHVRLRCAPAAAAAEAPALMAASATLLSLDCLSRLLTFAPEAHDDAEAAAIEESQSKART
jgi:hypothetical protein